MPTMMQAPKDSPLMVAWEAHKRSEEYANSKRWAAKPEHLEGSMWAQFLAGWNAAQACRCRAGECESKADKRCRMADEIAAGDQ